MVKLSPCLIWQIISFILPPNEYGFVYAWTMLGNIATDRLTEDADFRKKFHLFRLSSFWSWRVYKQAKLSHLGLRKPARIHWQADASKTSHCLVRIWIQKHNWAIFLRIWARRGRYSQWQSLSGHVEQTLCSQKLKRRILATFGFNRTALRATLLKLHSIFCALVLKIRLSAAELMSFGHLGAAIWHRWTIICGVPSKISVTLTSKRQLTL